MESKFNIWILRVRFDEKNILFDRILQYNIWLAWLSLSLRFHWMWSPCFFQTNKRYLHWQFRKQLWFYCRVLIFHFIWEWSTQSNVLEILLLKDIFQWSIAIYKAQPKWYAYFNNNNVNYWLRCICTLHHFCMGILQSFHLILQ